MLLQMLAAIGLQILIIQASVVLRRTVFDDTDGCFYNLSRSHYYSQV